MLSFVGKRCIYSTKILIKSSHFYFCSQNKKELLLKNDKYFELSPLLTVDEDQKKLLLKTMLICPNFVTLEEEESLMKEIQPYVSRLHYETEHWDDAIHGYRETEFLKWNKKNQIIIEEIRNIAFSGTDGTPQLKYVHVLDLEKNGVIKPHIDSVRFCGDTITGLSLLSDSVMRLTHEKNDEIQAKILLPRLSLYIMKDFSRYEFKHEILEEEESIFKENKVPRDRRISVICRNEPKETVDTNNVLDNIFKNVKSSDSL